MLNRCTVRMLDFVTVRMIDYSFIPSDCHLFNISKNGERIHQYMEIGTEF